MRGLGAAEDFAERVFPSVQLGEAVAGSFVAEVVGVAAEGVDGIEGRPVVAGKEERADGEVFVVGPGEAFAIVVGGPENGLAAGDIRGRHPSSYARPSWSYGQDSPPALCATCLAG